MSPIKDMAGQRLGKLLVLRCVGRNKWGLVNWLCRCDCGKEKIVTGSNLREGYTKSCGCLWRLPKGMAALNAVFKRYKIRATRHEREFTLTKEVFQELTSAPCHYCGALPSSFDNPAKMNGKYIYNGLDRVDNERGYVPDNVVPCCRTCNQGKGTLTQDEFKEYLQRAYNHWIKET